MPRGRSSIEAKEAIVRANFTMMKRRVIPQWNYNGSESQWVLFEVGEGPWAGVVLQQRYNLARNRYLGGNCHNEFTLTSVHDKDSYIRSAFLNAKPSRIISSTWTFESATEPIPFYFDPLDLKALTSCNNSLSLFASEHIIFLQPWCEFSRSLDDATQEVWIRSLENIDESIRYAWRSLTIPGRIINKDWTYVNTTTPVKFTLDQDEKHDFSGIEFQQTVSHWTHRGINLRSVVDMNQALDVILSKIDCSLVDASFDYYAASEHPEERFRQPIVIVDEFFQEYTTTLECLTKGMTSISVGAGQLPWNRGTSRLTPSKIRSNPRFLGSPGIFYVAEIPDSAGNSYLKMGITTKQSPSHRCPSYKTLTAVSSNSLLDVSILECALLRATIRHRPSNYRELLFPLGFGGGNSEVRNLSVLDHYYLVGNDSERRLASALSVAASFREVKNLSSELIHQTVAALAI
ncbi:hypothetical protein KBZ19_08880 [Synechococcus sp. L2F]|nr:hypothetical protein [Synechococcus sp. L2F]